VKIAVVGAGISGLGAAWLLSRRHDVTLFEAESRLGGHSNTALVATADGTVAIDTGFIVYNLRCYPNLIALFEHLNVPVAPTAMSFAVSLDRGAYEYSGNGLAGFFGQRRNLLSVAHWQMARDIPRFHRDARALVDAAGSAEFSLGEWLEARRYSKSFIERHIVPMGAAIWSTPASDMLEFPAVSFARFFANHGLLQVADQPRWQTVRGGSREYVNRIIADFGGRVASGQPVTALERTPAGVVVTTREGATERFDRCLVATHADDTMRILSDADDEERATLGAFHYARNEAVLHTDISLMPSRRHLWASWNYLAAQQSGRLSLTYWMNSLQPLETRTNYFVTLNPPPTLDPKEIVQRYTYHHPMFDGAALAAQRRLWLLQGRRRTWFAGSYFGYGFHEDGLQAGLAAAEEMGDVRRPWSVENESGRIHLAASRRPGQLPVAAQ